MTWLDEQHLIYAINDAGRFELRRLNLATGNEDLLDSGDLIHPHYDAAGKRLVAASRRSERDLAILLPNGTTRAIASSTSDDHHGRWSPDGRFVAFVSRRSGHDELWLADASDSSARRLTRFDGATVRYPAWSPDGQRLLFTVQTDTGERLHEADLITGQVTEVASASATATTPAWMPDGLRWVYGCGEATADAICVGSDEGEQRFGVGYFRPAPVGEGMIVAVDRHGTLVRFLVDGSSNNIPAWDGLPEDGRLAWDILGDTLVYARPDGTASGGRVIRRDIASGEETVLYEGKMPLAEGSIDALPDGRVLITRFDAASDDLVWMSAPHPTP
jgi:Tol biopolymer transport system component